LLQQLLLTVIWLKVNEISFLRKKKKKIQSRTIKNLSLNLMNLRYALPQPATSLESGVLGQRIKKSMTGEDASQSSQHGKANQEGQHGKNFMLIPPPGFCLPSIKIGRWPFEFLHRARTI
jgi:hypothetical protein